MKSGDQIKESGR